jgi:hypothetical protein
MFIKKLIPFFDTESGSGGGSGYMVSPEHLQNVYTSESEPGDNNPVDEEVVEIEVDSEEVPAEETLKTPELPPEMHKIKWNGEEKEVSYEELLNLSQQGFDYTQKTQQVQADRKRLEAEFQVEREISQLFSQHPELAEKFINMTDEFMGNLNGQAPDQMQAPNAQQLDIMQNPQFQQMQQQNQQMQQQLQQLMQTQQQASVQKEWNELHARYPDSKEMTKELADFADQNGVNLENAYRLMNFDKIQQRTKDQLAASATKKQVARTTNPANASGGNAPTPSAPKSYADVAALIKAEGINLFN